MLAFSQGWQTKTASYLWVVFGTINQLLAAMVLLVVTIYLRRKGKNIAYTVLPMLFLLITTAWAMIWKVTSLLTPAAGKGILARDIALAIIGIAALVLESFVVIFGTRALLRNGDQVPESEADSPPPRRVTLGPPAPRKFAVQYLTRRAIRGRPC